MTNQPPLNPDAIQEAAVASRHALWDEDFWGFSSESDAQDYGFEEGAKWARERLAVAQPVVNSVEVVPAKLQTISWESNPEHNVWTLEQDQTFVGLVVDAQRGWSMADKITLHIERPEVKP